MRARRSRDEWSAIVRSFERSGESQEAFCARRELKVATFRWWLCTLRRSAVREEAVRVLPVEVVAGCAVVDEPSGQGDIVLSVAGVELRVPVGADARYVAALVAELRRC